MDPITLGYLGLGLFQLWGGSQQANAIEENAALTARINELNADAAELDAYEAEQQGFTEVARYASIVDGTIGSQKVAFASEDVDVSFGSAKDIQDETRLTGQLNALDIQNAAHNKFLGFKDEARSIRLGATMQRAQAEIDAFGARIGGLTSAVSTGISGFSRLERLKK